MSIVARQSPLYSFITCWYFLVTLLKCSWYAVRGKPKLHPIVPAQVLQIFQKNKSLGASLRCDRLSAFQRPLHDPLDI